MKGTDKNKWENAIFEEHERMVKNKVWIALPKKDVPKNAKLMSSTWAMQKKSNGTYRARLNARGYEQVGDIHYNSSNISSPVTNDATISIIMVLMIIFKWSAPLVDVKGAFLCGNFEDGEEIFMEVLEGFEEFYGTYVLLLLLQTIYGLKHAAMAFWRELVKALTDMNFKRSAADPCLYYSWTMYGLVVWLSWIDDFLVAVDKKAVEAAKEQMKSIFECDDLGELNEYVGCKIDRNEDSVKFTQPVMIQSYEDEFELNKTRQVSTPSEQGNVLMKCDKGTELGGKEQTKYRSRVGKLLHMMRWSRPEI
jgi:hypothetical protein